MRLTVSREDDALYFRLDEADIVESEEVQPGVILDFDQNDRLVGIEILGISARVPPERLHMIQFETV